MHQRHTDNIITRRARNIRVEGATERSEAHALPLSAATLPCINSEEAADVNPPDAKRHEAGSEVTRRKEGQEERNSGMNAITGAARLSISRARYQLFNGVLDHFDRLFEIRDETASGNGG